MSAVLSYLLTPRMRLSPGRSGQSGNFRDIHEIIPGATLRGALGAAWWGSPTDPYSGPDPQGAFDLLFGRLLDVTDAVPFVADNEGNTSELVAFEPNSWLICKYRSSCDSAPVDLAAPDGEMCPGCTPSTKAAGRTDRVCPSCERCPRCDVRAEPGRGWRVRSIASMVTRTSLVNEVPKPGALFTRSVLEPATADGAQIQNVLYAGRLVLRPGHDAQLLTDAITWLRRQRDLRVGGSRSTMGKATLTIADATERLPDVCAGRVAFYLTSPAILLDDNGAPSFDLGGHLTRVAASAGASDPSVVKVYLRPTVVTGWHGLAGMPKPTEPAIDAGAVAVLDGMTADAVQQLLTLGVGARRREGNGQLATDPLRAIPSRRPPVAAATGTDYLLEATPPADADSAVSTPPNVTPSHHLNQPEVAAPPEPAPSALAEFLGAISPQDQPQAIKRLLVGARQTSRIRQNRLPESIVADKVRHVLDLPWGRQLSGPQRDDVTNILTSDNIESVILELQRREGEKA